MTSVVVRRRGQGSSWQSRQVSHDSPLGQARPRGLEDGSQALEGKVRLCLHALGRFHRGADADLGPDDGDTMAELRRLHAAIDDGTEVAHLRAIRMFLTTARG
jgi:hypothetical protein